MQVIILGRIDKELDDDVFVKVMTANFLTVYSASNLYTIDRNTKKNKEIQRTGKSHLGNNCDMLRVSLPAAL